MPARFIVGAVAYVHPKCRNDNSIGIEMCSDKDENGNYITTEATVENTVRLGKYSDLFSVPIERCLRHFDDWCPEPWVRNPELWEDFKNRLVATDARGGGNGSSSQRLSENDFGFQGIIES